MMREQCLTCFRPKALVMFNCRPLCADCFVILINRLTPVKHPANVVDFTMYKAFSEAAKEIYDILDSMGNE